MQQEPQEEQKSALEQFGVNLTESASLEWAGMDRATWAWAWAAVEKDRTVQMEPHPMTFS